VADHRFTSGVAATITPGVIAATPEARPGWPWPPPMRIGGCTGHPQKRRGGRTTPGSIYWLAGQPVKGLVFLIFFFKKIIIKYKIMVFLENIAFTPRNSYSSHFFRGIGIFLRKVIGIPRNRPLPNKRMIIP